MITYFNDHKIKTIVASRTLAKTKGIIAGLEHISAVAFDIESANALEELDTLVQKVDLVISLLPYIHHVAAAKIALKYSKHFCTSSYVSDAMKELEAEALEKGVVLFNECGVDPGLDHMSAKQVIDHVHAENGKIMGFLSICGGLPAPMCNDNPFGYKLSWSPRGVLLAGRNTATFYQDGEVVNAPEIFSKDAYRKETIDNIDYEWYPNRNSCSYREIYGIPEIQTLIRGTYRNAGWCDVLKMFTDQGLCSLDETDFTGKTFKQFFEEATSKVELTEKIREQAEWLGLYSEEAIPSDIKTPLDVLCKLCQEKLVYAEGEKDMILMKHTFEVEYTKAKREQLTSTLINYGLQPDSFSSMSRTVSLPLAVAVRAMLDGRLKLSGLVRPVVPEVYNLILSEMETMDVKFVEKVSPVHFWLRSEIKPGEERVALSPADAKKCIDAGFKISVERSAHRCISDEEYAAVGCELVPTETWMSAPRSAIIIGLKELPENDDPLQHRHIFFAHCYKDQGGWKEVLKKFTSGGGLLWDMEFLTDDSGRRVAAFGRPAGIVGMALGLIGWANRKAGKTMGARSSWKSTDAMIADCKAALAEFEETPSILVIGALGRCGKGATWVAEQCGLSVVKWDLEETKAGGPFPQLLDQDILVNCIYLKTKIAPFLTQEMIEGDRQLSMFVDVSCDTSNPNNPFPFYNTGTTMDSPILQIVDDAKNPLDVVAIDHLPSLIPTESSLGYSETLVPHLLDLKDTDSPVWKRAEELFYHHCGRLE